MKILVTGTAGFIGAATAELLLSEGNVIYGIDNLTEYYDSALKKARLSRILGNQMYKHYHLDISNLNDLKDCFDSVKPQIVVHLAAQAGVRHSIDHPQAFIDSNVTGFLNILEVCKDNAVEHLIYASSSSVYGANTSIPFCTDHKTDSPLNIYGATKKSNELMAHAYGYLYKLRSTGLRFFTVYGPWGRPDMALLKFADSILSDKPIDLYNHGDHKRDFTFIDDVVETINRIIKCSPTSINSGQEFARIFNVGNGQPVSLCYFLECIENCLGKKARINSLPLAAGDMLETACDAQDLHSEINFKPSTPIAEGISKTILWYREYRAIKHNL